MKISSVVDSVVHRSPTEFRFEAEIVHSTVSTATLPIGKKVPPKIGADDFLRRPTINAIPAKV